MNTRPTTLLDLSSDTLNKEVAKDLDTRSVINVSLANKYTYRLFKPTLLQRLKKYVERSAKQQVEKLLKIHLDFDSNHLRDLCQMALRSGDIDLCNVIVKRRKNLVKEIAFPEKLIDKSNCYDFNAIVAAIESGQNVEAALAQFRVDLDKIVKEKGFPFQAMIQAYDIYERNYTPWSKDQCSLFSVKIIGYLQRLSPPWLKKAIATGTFNLTENYWLCRDTFILQSGESTDPVLDIPNKGLGFDSCVNKYGRLESEYICAGSVDLTMTENECFNSYLEYLEQKKQETSMSLRSDDTQKQETSMSLRSDDTQKRKKNSCVIS